ncbi:MAG: MATE family efflux transporter [Candidatus Marinimicrobia bacterium]|nr:MATE family efflux transporter [Candidatus Neomarinimicrobiota bacterium]
MILNKKDSNEILSIAWPTIIGMIGSTLMGLFDTAMVGRLSAEALAAVGLGNMLIWTAGSLVNSVNVGVQTVAARRVGEKKYSECGESIHNGIILSLIFGTLMTVLMWPFLTKIFPYINDDPSVVSMGNEYMAWRVAGILPAMLHFAFYGFFNGIGKTKVHIRASLISNSLNIFLNYVLIFGKFGFPAMGVKGAALGTVISTSVSALIYFIWLLNPKIKDRYHVFKTSFYNKIIMRRIFSLSFASGVQNFFVLIGFTLFLIIVGRMGTFELAATDIIFNILSFSFMPGFGFGLAAGTLVGNYMGKQNFERAAELTRETIILNVIFMGAIGVIFMLIPRQILSLFTLEAEVINIGVIPLRILGIVQFIDAVGMTLMGALRGAGDTSYVAWVDTLINWFIFIPLTWFFGFYLGYGINGAWAAFIIYLVIFATLMYRRFLAGKWKDIVV